MASCACFATGLNCASRAAVIPIFTLPSNPSRRPGLEIRPFKIIIRHYDYLAGLKPAKLKQAARLLKLELGERPGQLYYLSEYGRTLLQLKDSRAGDVLAQAARQVVKQEHEAAAPTPLTAALCEYLLQLPDEKLPAGLTREKLEELCECWFPRRAPLLWIRAQQAFAAGNYAAAEKLLRRLVRLGERQDYDRHLSSDPRIIGDDARLNLGGCLVRQAKLRRPRQFFAACSRAAGKMRQRPTSK